MEIIELREMFKDISGRADLSDAACDLYINAGQKFLDDLVDHTKTPGQQWGVVQQGKFYYDFGTQAKLVEAVDLVDAEGNLIHVQYLKGHIMRENDAQLIGLKPQGVPSYYTVASLRRIPDDADMAVDTFTGFREVTETGSVLDTNGVLFNVPVDKDYRIRIIGKFYSTPLSDDNTESWWSKNYELTLLDAAMYKLESKYRNTQGMKDWMVSITDTLKQIEYNQIEKESQHISVMKG